MLKNKEREVFLGNSFFFASRFCLLDLICFSFFLKSFSPLFIVFVCLLFIVFTLFLHVFYIVFACLLLFHGFCLVFACYSWFLLVFCFLLRYIFTRFSMVFASFPCFPIAFACFPTAFAFSIAFACTFIAFPFCLPAFHIVGHNFFPGFYLSFSRVILLAPASLLLQNKSFHMHLPHTPSDRHFFSLTSLLFDISSLSRLI